MQIAPTHTHTHKLTKKEGHQWIGYLLTFLGAQLVMICGTYSSCSTDSQTYKKNY